MYELKFAHTKILYPVDLQSQIINPQIFTQNDRKAVLQILFLYLLQSSFASNLMFKCGNMQNEGAGETNHL